VRLFAIVNEDQHMMLMEAVLQYQGDHHGINVITRCYDSSTRHARYTDARARFRRALRDVMFPPPTQLGWTDLQLGNCAQQGAQSNDCALFAASFLLHRLRSPSRVELVAEHGNPLFLLTRQDVILQFAKEENMPKVKEVKK